MECTAFNNLIMPYLSDQLDEGDRELFEMHYFQCDVCYDNLRIAQHLHSGAVPVRTDVKSRLFLFKPVFALSSIAALILLVISTFWLMNRSDQRAHLYQISEFSTPVYIKTELRGNVRSDIFEKAMVFYNDARYADALAELQKISSKSNVNYKIVFFKGICHLMLNQLDSAENEFSAIIAAMDPSYFDEAIYYKGIVLLRSGEKTEAIDVLENLSSDKYSPLSRKALTLIERIRNLD